MKLRFAEQGDVPALLEIYGCYIKTDVTFEYQLPSQEEFSHRVEAVCGLYPYLVAEENGQIQGYAYAHRIGERAAYEWGAELSIYLKPEAAGLGLGEKLYTALEKLLRLQGVRTVYGLVASPNPASQRLHEKMGFRVMGVQRNAGYKNGRWIDLIWYEKPIAEYGAQPEGLLPVGELPKEQIDKLLAGLK